MEGLKQPQVTVVMVPLPAQGHLNQFLHLSHLITSYDIPVHYAGTATHNRLAKLRLQGRNLSENLHFHDFPLPPFSSPPPNPNSPVHFPGHMQPLFEAAASHFHQPLCHLLHQLSAQFRRVIVIHDMVMATVVQGVNSAISNVEIFTLIPISAFYLFFSTWQEVPEKPFQLDGTDVRESDVPTNEGCFTEEFAEFLAKQEKAINSNLDSGKIYNTSRLIEGGYLELVEKLSNNSSAKHFALGPFFPVAEIKGRSGIHGQSSHGHECLEWLEKQERESVLYVSFGSTTTFSDEQIREMAIGLERSEQKFIWVLRSADTGDVLTSDEGECIEPQLPEGYEERVRSRGMVVREWAPQLEILAHSSTGGFMSHCGWNSCMESISMGVPILAWPLHSDQPKNSVLITEVLRIGTPLRAWTHRAELVTSTTVENGVRRLMASKEGEEMRKRAAELGEAVQRSVAEGGASRLEMDSFIAHITR